MCFGRAERAISSMRLLAIFSIGWFRWTWFGVDLARGDIPGSLGEFGWDGSAFTWFRMDPKERTVALIFFQYIPFDKPALELFSTLFYRAIVD